MDITASRADSTKPYVITLNAAPQGTVVEVRMTNTMNGSSAVHTAEVKNGSITIPTPLNFGQHFAFDARVLTADRADKVISFNYEATETDNNFKLVAPNQDGTAPVNTNPLTIPPNVTDDATTAKVRGI